MARTLVFFVYRFSCILVPYSLLIGDLGLDYLSWKVYQASNFVGCIRVCTLASSSVACISCTVVGRSRGLTTVRLSFYESFTGGAVYFHQDSGCLAVSLCHGGRQRCLLSKSVNSLAVTKCYYTNSIIPSLFISWKCL